MDERERVLLTLAGMRVFMGDVLARQPALEAPDRLRRGWLLGLPRTYWSARAHYGISPPVRSLVVHVLAPHATAVGWLVFLVGLLTGLSLVLGFATRLGAALGLIQAIMIALFLANAPGEWLYGYLMFVLLSALPLLLPVSRRLSLDDVLGRDP